MALAALAGTGCTTDATETNGAGMPGGGEGPLVSGPLCAECGPLAGGESSDFEGDLPVCWSFRQERRISDAEATALGFDMAAVRALATREFSSPVRWVPTSGGLAPGLPATGFSSQTNVSGALRATGELLYRGLDPGVCDADGNCTEPGGSRAEPCAEYAASQASTLELELDIETADGAIEATTLRGGISFGRGPLPRPSIATLAVDLDEVSGTLRLDPNRPGPRLGQLVAVLALVPDTVRGTLSPVILPDEPETNPMEGVPGDILLAPSWRYEPITLAWPPDGCGLESLPINAASAEGNAARERLAVEYPAARAFVNAASPMAANWDDVRALGRDGVAARLGLELIGDPEFHCVEADGSATFETEVHVWTDDGRLDWTTRMNGALFSRPEETPGLYVSSNQTLQADDAFWSSTLRDVDLLGAQSVELQFRASFGLDDANAYVDGSVSGELVPASCSLDVRCGALSDASDCADCGTTLDVDYLYWSFFR